MENILHGIPNTIAYTDDILVNGNNDAEYLSKLEFRLIKQNYEYIVNV